MKIKNICRILIRKKKLINQCSIKAPVNTRIKICKKLFTKFTFYLEKQKKIKYKK